jgi:hypothetical protein
MEDERMALTEFEERRVAQACKLIGHEEIFLGRLTTGNERRALLKDRTPWSGQQIDETVMAIALNGDDVGEGERP